MAKKEGKECPVLGPLLFHLYGILSRGFIRRGIQRLAKALEGGETHSLTLRRIFLHYHHIEVGLYTGGGVFVPWNFREGPPGMKIGRYCSCAYTARAFNANHPLNLRSTSAVFCNPELGYTTHDIVPRTPLEIGNDVWLGHNSTVLSSVSKIGHGAVIGAGAVVHRDVPPYAVVVGNPARVVRYRFSPEIIEELLASRWWEKSLDELLVDIDKFQTPLEGNEVR